MTDEKREPRTPEEIDADIAKTRAEAAKTEAATRLFEARTKKMEHEAEVARIEAEEAGYALKKVAICFERDQEKRDRELADNRYHHIYYFNETVTSSALKECMQELSYWSRSDPQCDMEIIFYSPGGSVIDGMALYDFIQQFRGRGHKITTTCMGYAASMAGILLQAGDVRRMGPESYMLIHEVSFGAVGKIGEVEDEVIFVKKIQSRVLDIFACRSKLSKAAIARKWRRKDWWLDSTEALKLGFVDELV